MPSTPLVLLAHAAATLYMVGLIWFVQVVHSPLFSRVGADGFVPYAAAHGVLTTWVVGPPRSPPTRGESGPALGGPRPGGGSSSPTCCAPRCGPDAGG